MSRASKLSLLGMLFAVCAAATLWQSWLDRRWQTTPPGELYGVVAQQISAFRADDYSAAYRQVSMNFRDKCDIASFADLAHTEYPALLRSSREEFGQVTFEGRRAFIPAYFFLPEGNIIPCIYTLIHEANGWKIDKVRILPQWPANQRLGGTRT